MRRYAIDLIENRYSTHWIISLSPLWRTDYSWSKEGRTIHEYKGSGDQQKVLIDAPASITGEFLLLLLQQAFQRGSTLVVVRKEDLNNTNLHFHVNEINATSYPEE